MINYNRSLYNKCLHKRKDLVHDKNLLQSAYNMFTTSMIMISGSTVLISIAQPNHNLWTTLAMSGSLAAVYSFIFASLTSKIDVRGQCIEADIILNEMDKKLLELDQTLKKAETVGINTQTECYGEEKIFDKFENVEVEDTILVRIKNMLTN